MEYYYGTGDLALDYDRATGVPRIEGTADSEWLLGTLLDDAIGASAGDDTVLAGPGDDAAAGGEGADRLYGEAGDDRLTGGAGDDTLDGGAGRDTGVYGGARGAYRIEERADGVLVAGPDGADMLHDVEALDFADTIVFLDDRRLAPEQAGTVGYLYETALDRDGEIDLAGLNFWIDAREQGVSERDLAAAFLASDEFVGAYGPADSYDAAGLVALLYLNVLDRPGEAEGVAFWTGIAEQPGFGSDALLLAFATSPENVGQSPQIATLAETEPGIWDFAAV